MGILKEFKEFAVKGNILDLAVGIVVGTAFGKIVSSFVADVIMPPIGVLLGGVDFSDLAITVREAVGESPAVLIRYGQFLQTIIDFTIIAFAVFMALKVVNRLKKKEEVKADAQPEQAVLPQQEVLLREIRDLLKERR